MCGPGVADILPIQTSLYAGRNQGVGDEVRGELE